MYVGDELGEITGAVVEKGVDLAIEGVKQVAENPSKAVGYVAKEFARGFVGDDLGEVTGVVVEKGTDLLVKGVQGAGNYAMKYLG